MGELLRTAPSTKSCSTSSLVPIPSSVIRCAGKTPGMLVEAATHVTKSPLLIQPPLGYRFARIEGVTRLPQRAPYPPRIEYDPEQVFRDSIGAYVSDEFPVADVELELSERWKIFMESHRWHRSQRLVSTKFGCLLRMRVRLCPELERWVLGFGAEARVLRPKSLQTKVARISAEMRALYARTKQARNA